MVLSCRDHGAGQGGPLGPPPDRQHRHHHHRADEQEGGRHGQSAEVDVTEGAAVVGPAESIAGAGHEGHAEADEVGTPGRLPGLHDHDDADEADQHRGELVWRQAVAREQHQTAQHRDQRGGRIADAGECRRHALLTQSEKGERQHRQKHARHSEVGPGAPPARQPPAGHRQEHNQRGGTGEDPQTGDLKRCERPQADLHQEEARAPDQGQAEELELPRHPLRRGLGHSAPRRRRVRLGGRDSCAG